MAVEARREVGTASSLGMRIGVGASVALGVGYIVSAILVWTDQWLTNGATLAVTRAFWAAYPLAIELGALAALVPLILIGAGIAFNVARRRAAAAASFSLLAVLALASSWYLSGGGAGYLPLVEHDWDFLPESVAESIEVTTPLQVPLEILELVLLGNAIAFAVRSKLAGTAPAKHDA